MKYTVIIKEDVEDLKRQVIMFFFEQQWDYMAGLMKMRSYEFQKDLVPAKFVSTMTHCLIEDEHQLMNQWHEA